MTQQDTCNQEGYERIRRKIASVWKGHDIKFAAVPAAFTYAARTSRVDLRSDMVNGLPRGLFLARMKTEGRAR